MVNFGLNSASILGIFLAVAGAGLYFLRSIRPELSRDHDIFFAAVGLLCGLILLFQGWRLDPILQFGQFLLTGSTIFFGVETIRLRGLTTEQARRNTPIVDRDRPVSRTRAYTTEAELDEIEPYEEDDRYSNSPRLVGTPERRNSSRRRSTYDSDEPRSTRRSSPRYRDTDTTKETRRSPRGTAYDNWEDSSDMWEDRPPARRPRPSTRNQSPPSSSRSTPQRRPRPSRDNYPPVDEPEIISTDYVPYQPLDEAEQEENNEDWGRSSTPESRPRRDRKNIGTDRPTPTPSDEPSDDESNPLRFDY